MPTLIAKPTRIEAAGNKPKIIQEHIGRVNSATEAVSVAHMTSPAGWVEPGQTPNSTNTLWFSAAPSALPAAAAIWTSAPAKP